MPLFLDEQGAHDPGSRHDHGDGKGPVIAARVIEDHPPHVGPEPSPQVVYRGHDPADETDMGQAEEPPDECGRERRRDKKGETEYMI